MDFKSATDALCRCVTHGELAEELGVSLPTVRQARLAGDAHAHRTPPEGWEKAVKHLAEKQLRHFQRLLAQLER